MNVGQKEPPSGTAEGSNRQKIKSIAADDPLTSGYKKYGR